MTNDNDHDHDRDRNRDHANDNGGTAQSPPRRQAARSPP